MMPKPREWLSVIYTFNTMYFSVVSDFNRSGWHERGADGSPMDRFSIRRSDPGLLFRDITRTMQWYHGFSINSAIRVLRNDRLA